MCGEDTAALQDQVDMLQAKLQAIMDHFKIGFKYTPPTPEKFEVIEQKQTGGPYAGK